MCSVFLAFARRNGERDFFRFFSVFRGGGFEDILRVRGERGSVIIYRRFFEVIYIYVFLNIRLRNKYVVFRYVFFEVGDGVISIFRISVYGSGLVGSRRNV